MASNSILKLQVDDKQYEASLKSAQQGLQALMNALRNSGKSFSDLDKNTEQYVRALGNMEATAKTTRGRIGEMSSAFVELSQVEKQLTDQERQSPVGKALTESLNQLKQRTIEAKQELADLDKQLTNQKASANTGGMFSGIGSKMEGALAVFGGNLMTKAAGFAASFASEIAGCVSQGIELARAGEGVRIAFERLGRGDILDGLREATHGTVTDIELMKAAVKFNDFKLPVEELGTMLAFAQQKAKDTGQSVDYMVDSIVTGLGRKSLMILDNLGLSAAEIKEKMAETGDMTKAVGAIIREQMSKAGDYVETAADRAAQANVSLQNKMEELGRKFAPVEEASNQLWTSMKIGILDIIGGPLATLLNQLTEAGRLKNMLKDMNGEPGSGNTKVDQQLKKLNVIKKAGGSDYIFNSTLSGMLEDYNRQIMALDKKIKDTKKLSPDQQASKFVRDEVQKMSEQMKALGMMRDQLAAGAKELSKPVDVKIDTKGAEQNVESLKVKLIELQAQRKKAIAAGDTDLSKNLAKQISQVKADIRGLDPNALKTTNSTKNLDEEQKVQAKINDLLKEALTADAHRQGEIRQQVAELQKQQEKYKDIKNLALGILPKDKEAVFTIDGQLSEETKKNLREIQGVTIDDKSITVTANTSDALKALQGIEGVTIDPKTVTITATDEALPKLRDIEGITIDDKTMTVTADTQEAMQKVQELIGQVSTATLQVKVAPPDLDKLFPDMSKQNYNTGYAGSAQAKYDSARVDMAVSPMNFDAINDYIGSIKGILKDANLGDELYTSMMEKLKDASTMTAVLQQAMTSGVYGVDLTSVAEEMKQKLLEGDISEDAWQEFLERLNEKIADADLKLTFDVDTKKIETVAKKQQKEAAAMAKEWQAAGSAIQAVGNAMNQIEDPAAKVLGTIAQAVATMALSYSQAAASPAVTSTGWGWIAFAATGVATMLSSIAAIKKATSGFASGGVIPGNSYSGDNMRGMTPDGNVYGLNAGEVVLNRAQQGNLAAQFEGSNAGSGVESQPFITGELLYLGVNNYLRRTGRGEIVTSR